LSSGLGPLFISTITLTAPFNIDSLAIVIGDKYRISILHDDPENKITSFKIAWERH
jgi:hypothetical protein